MVFGLPLLDAVLFVWVIDEFGNRRRVRVKDEEERQRLLARNAEMRRKLKERGRATKKHKTVKRAKKRAVRKSKKLWDW